MLLVEDNESYLKVFIIKNYLKEVDMEKDNKILISAILIIGIAVFASSLNTGISGRATGSCLLPVATVNPGTIAAGGTVRVDFTGYIKSPADIVTEDGRLIETITRPCFGQGNVCKDGGSFEVKTLSRKLSTKWQDGVYCVKARTCEKIGGLRDRVIIQGSCFTIDGSADSYRYG